MGGHGVRLEKENEDEKKVEERKGESARGGKEEREELFSFSRKVTQTNRVPLFLLHGSLLY